MARVSVLVLAFNRSVTAEMKIELAAPGVLTTPFKHKPSAHQLAIFNWVSKGTGSAIINAVAGSGKSTTIKQCLRYIPGLTDMSNVAAKTFHGLGLGAVSKRLGKFPTLDDAKLHRLLRDRRDSKVDDALRSGDNARAEAADTEYRLYSKFVAKLVSHAKLAGIGPLVDDTPRAWLDIIEHQDMFLDDADATEDRAVEIAREVLAASNEVALTGDIDFDDQIYLPLLWRLRLWGNDWVFIDEAQDTSPVRRALAKLALRPGGRLIAVGDPKQAIYGFAGASSDSLDRIKADFNCIELPLTVSYRCPQAVCARVNAAMPNIPFSVAVGAAAGQDVSMSVAKAVLHLGAGDVILCRQTAPLVSLAFDLIGAGIGCKVAGKEIAEGLVALVKRQKAKGIEALIEKLLAWRDREVSKFTTQGKEGKAESVMDRIACITTVIDRLHERERTIPALIAKLESMFSDDAKGLLVLSTIHRLKGAEFRNVAILAPELMPSKWARQAWQYEQEINLMYVAWTRAKNMLIELTDTRLMEKQRAAQ